MKGARTVATTGSRRAPAGSRRGAATSAGRSTPRLTLDEAFIALLIGAMDANRHVSPEELARAHHIIWSMKRYRRKSGEHVGRLVDAMRTMVGVQGSLPVIAAAARAIPVRLRPAAFAVSADLVLADGKMEPAERRFLDRLASDLELERPATAGILTAMLVKNSV
jgi:tellurite resistance protein